MRRCESAIGPRDSRTEHCTGTIEAMLPLLPCVIIYDRPPELRVKATPAVR